MSRTKGLGLTKRTAVVVSCLLTAIMLFSTGCQSAAVTTTQPAASTAAVATSAPAASAPAESAQAAQTPAPIVQHPPFILWAAIKGSSTDDNLLQKYWSEKMGFNVQIQWMQGDMMTALNLKLSSGGFDDAALFPNDEVVKAAMIKSNLVMQTDEFFTMKDKYPNLSTIPAKTLELTKASDGHYWFIPTWFDQNPENPWPGWAGDAWFVRTDLLEKTGMTEDSLSTIEGVESFLTAAAQLKDDSGKALLPLGFVDTGANSILNAFGVDTATAGGVASVKKTDNGFVFTIDDAGYKSAYQWMAKMMRKGLIDQEVVTQKTDLFKQKVTAGSYAIVTGSMWNLTDSWQTLNGPEKPGWYIKPVKNPKVTGVNALGIASIINPYSQNSVYISKNSKNVDSILAFMNYTLEPTPLRQQEMNEGPLGWNWDWTKGSMGEWDFKEPYKTDRMSGDAARIAKLSPFELWRMASYSNVWYPWWTLALSPSTPKGQSHTTDFTQVISKFGNIRTIHSYDLVTAKPGGLWEKNAQTLQSIRSEFEAKLLLSKDDADFEAIWKDYQTQLEQRISWEAMKTEWNQVYQEFIKANGEF